MKTTTFLILFGVSLFGASAGTAALMQSNNNNSPELMPMGDLDSESKGEEHKEAISSSSQSSAPVISNIELYKFQSSLARPYHNPEAPWNLCKWTEFNVVDPSLDGVTDISNAKKTNYFKMKGAKSSFTLAKSCLLVSVDRKEYVLPSTGAKRWSGTFSWLWSVIHEDRALVTVNVAETTKDKKLLLTGVTYLLEREDKTQLWKVKHYAEITKDDKREINSRTFDTLFPKPNSSSIRMSFDDEVDSNWHFIENAEKMDEICQGDECLAPGVQVWGSGSWRKYEWTPQETFESWRDWYCDNMSGWSGHPETNLSIPWWDYMYGKGNFNLSHHLSFFTYGIWEKRV